ncbi:dimethylaniline monooxygenase 2 [Colletotrichum camelliae]|nr:dimethylaniline monooxygenase 2 [Colletotrichum camelliae]
MTEGNKIAIIGLGPLGLVALKNCLEEGFEATGFDRIPYPGGLWTYTPEDRVSALPTTVVNISKERGCFTDFPFPAGEEMQNSFHTRDVDSLAVEVPSLCSAGDVQRYLASYVEHFNLRPSLRLSTSITRVYRDESANKWVIEIDGGPDEMFDRVIMATGQNHTPKYPDIKKIELFRGETLHSKSFKSPEGFKGKDVLIIGLGNTGADTAASLVGHANNIYLSHRHGCLVLPRVKDGKPVDHTINVRYVTWQRVFERFFPSLVEKLFNDFGKRLQDEAFNIRPEWKLSPAPSLKKYLPLFSDNLTDSLESGAVQSVDGVSRIVGPKNVELTDGKVIKVDTIIYCTGYMSDYSLLDPKYDPTRETTPDWAAARGSRGKPLPRLYQGVFSLSHPHSLAFQGAVALTMSQFQINDLSSMAVTQVWKGRSALPPQEEMEQAVDKHHAWMVELAREGSVLPQTVNPYQWVDWADQTAGTGVNKYLGWGWKGWKFWFQEPRLCSILMGGVYSPHIYRIFDGKRKKWDGARTEIERLYKVANEKPKLS